MLMIALGGALGSVSRYLTVQLAGRIWCGAFPYGTLAVNVIGSFLMGVAVAVLLDRVDGEPSRWVPLLMTGFLGGFTTFSAFSLDAYYLLENGRFWTAAFYASVSVLGSLIALAVGITCARAFLP